MQLTFLREDPSEKLIEEIAALYCEIWPSGSAQHRSKTTWAFAQNPLGCAPLVVARDHEQHLVGVRAGIPWSSSRDHNQGRVVQLHGTAVRPDFRRIGIFRRLTERFLDEATSEDFELIYNVSVAESRAGYERLGWTYVSCLRSLFLPVRPLRLMSMRNADKLSLSLDSNSPLAAPSFVDIEPFMQQRDRHLQTDLKTRYGTEFFAWRFGSQDYKWIGDSSRGYLVYRTKTRGRLREVLLGDAWPAGSSLMPLLWSLIPTERPDVIVSWTSVHHPLYRPLRRAGFLSRPGHGLNLGYRRLSTGDLPAAPSLMAADIDTF